MNNKSTPNQMRILLRRMRGEKYAIGENVTEPKKNLSMRDMLKITRKLNEEVDGEENTEKVENKKNVFDEPREQKKFLNYFKDMQVSVKFRPLKVYDDFIFWGGTIDGIIKFKFEVRPNESDSGVKFNYTDDFSPDNPDNDKILKRIKAYYDIFYKYWRDNVLQK